MIEQDNKELKEKKWEVRPRTLNRERINRSRSTDMIRLIVCITVPVLAHADHLLYLLPHDLSFPPLPSLKKFPANL